jgi:flavorubredoxin
VIRAAEPVIVDTGNALNREAWTNDVYSLVDPKDVRWIYLSHDDADHVGNLEVAMELSPQATVVSEWFFWERLSGTINIPLERQRWLSPGDSFEAGDRTLVTARPPMFDSPTTKGLYDSRTGVYWAVDSFACPVFEPMQDVADMDADAWRMTMTVMNRSATPWFEWVDPAKFSQHVDQVEQLGITTIASAHSPAITGERVAVAFDAMRDLPTTTPMPFPGQTDLDAMVAAAMAAAAPEAA